MRTYWGSDGKFKGYSQNFNVGFGIAYILGMVLLAVALYFLPIVAGVVCNITWSRKGLFFMFSDMLYINLDKFTYLLVLDMVIVKLH